jgi:hypothetical protein
MDLHTPGLGTTNALHNERTALSPLPQARSPQRLNRSPISADCARTRGSGVDYYVLYAWSGHRSGSETTAQVYQTLAR